MGKRHELAGQRFHRMTVLGFHDVTETPGGTKRSRWLCRCDCGVEKVVRGQDLVADLIRSCGCLRNDQNTERLTKHGHNRPRVRISQEYRSWQGAKTRCFNAKTAAYPSYGGRGIRMCDEWSRSFEAFLRDMGPSNGLELDRIDNNGNYEPGNCRWANQETQQNNRRSNRYVDLIDGGRMSISQLCRFMGVRESPVRQRLVYGWSLGEAIAIPIGGRGHVKEAFRAA